MSQPTRIEREHYQKLIGRQITAIIWEELEGRPLPVLLLTGWDRDGNAAPSVCWPIPRAMGRGIWITVCDSSAQKRGLRNSRRLFFLATGSISMIPSFLPENPR